MRHLRISKEETEQLCLHTVQEFVSPEHFQVTQTSVWLNQRCRLEPKNTFAEHRALVRSMSDMRIPKAAERSISSRTQALQRFGKQHLRIQDDYFSNCKLDLVNKLVFRFIV